MVLEDESMRGVPVLVYANKMDLPNAKNITEVSESLGLFQIRDRVWFV